MPSPAVTLTGTITGISGVSQAGTVTATLSNYGSNPPIITGAAQLAPITVSTTAASNGTWSLTLWGNDQITPINTFYTIAITPAGTYAALWIAEYTILSGSYDLSTLTPIIILPETYIPRGPQGPAGPTGAAGATGAQGPAGVGSTLIVVATSINFAVTPGSIALVTTGAGTITATLPTAVGIVGQNAYIKKVDSGAGQVTVATTSAQTIDGLSTYVLTDQWQYAEVISDGANWQIVSIN